MSAKIGLSAREQGLLATLMLPSAMELIDSGMLAVALPRIQAEFGVPVDVLSWVVAAGFLPRVTLMPVYGHIGDLFGKKRLFVLGLTVFLMGATLVQRGVNNTRNVIGSGILEQGGVGYARSETIPC